MPIRNIHERVINQSAAAVGALIDSLASKDDQLWPRDRWPAMRFDRPLEVGAVGGHGPIRYTVASYQPGESIQFAFSKPSGFIGHHRFEIEPLDAERTILRHVIDMRVKGKAILLWYLAIRPLHNALLEDALDLAERHSGVTCEPRHWSLWVRLLRRVMGSRRRR